MKQAEHCGFSSKPTLNQTGLLNEAYWLTRIAFSSASNVLALLVVGEVAALRAPGDGRVDDAADHLLDARLALGRAEPAAEVLLGDDVRRRLRPELRELDAALLEGGAVAARDDGVARLPFDLVERVPSGDREEAAHPEASCLVADGVDHLSGRQIRRVVLLNARHSRPSNCSGRGCPPPSGLRLERGPEVRARVGRSFRRARGPECRARGGPGAASCPTSPPPSAAAGGRGRRGRAAGAGSTARCPGRACRRST